MEKDEDYDERELIMKAIVNARKAIEQTFEEEGIDQAYFEFDIKAYSLSSDFEDVMFIIDDKEHIERKKEEG